jgi:hypothetical protein
MHWEKDGPCITRPRMTQFVADGLQTAQTLKLLLCMSNETANIAAEIEHDRTAGPKVTKPMISLCPRASMQPQPNA